MTPPEKHRMQAVPHQLLNPLATAGDKKICTEPYVFVHALVAGHVLTEFLRLCGLCASAQGRQSTVFGCC